MTYEYALVCRGVPTSLVNGLSLSDHEPIDLEKAILQQESYKEALVKCGLKLIELEEDEEFPDCVFVEDVAVAVRNRVFITNPGAESRRDETIKVEQIFNSLADQLNLVVGRVSNRDGAFIDGGDCLYTGREFFVGLSTRTNLKGVEELRNFFADIPVFTCRVEQNLHLKSCATMLDKDTIIIGATQAGMSTYEQIKEQSNFFGQYKFVHVPVDFAANVLNINGNIVYTCDSESFYADLNEFKAQKSTISVDNSEFKKIDGLLSCRNVLFSSG